MMSGAALMYTRLGNFSWNSVALEGDAQNDVS